MNKYLLIYEAKLLLKNYSCVFFGLIFPIVLVFLIIYGNLSNVPEPFVGEVKRSILFTINLISPLSIFLVGHAAITARDMEEGVYDRLDLFSIKQFQIACYKFLVYFIFVLVCGAIYFGMMIPIFDVKISGLELLRHTIYVFVVSVGYFFLSHAICLYTKKLSLSSGLSMLLYFATMILSGMMGISVENMPQPIKSLAQALPTSHFSSQEYLQEISQGTVNYSFVQSLIILVLLSLSLMALAVYKNRRQVN